MKDLPNKKIMGILISEEDYKEMEEKVYMITIKKVTYILYSEAISMYIPYLDRFKEKNARWQDLLRYCSSHGILAAPIRMSGWTPGFINIKYLERSIFFDCAIEDSGLFQTVLRYAFMRQLLGEIE